MLFRSRQWLGTPSAENRDASTRRGADTTFLAAKTALGGVSTTCRLERTRIVCFQRVTAVSNRQMSIRKARFVSADWRAVIREIVMRDLRFAACDLWQSGAHRTRGVGLIFVLSFAARFLIHVFAP